MKYVPILVIIIGVVLRMLARSARPAPQEKRGGNQPPRPAPSASTLNRPAVASAFVFPDEEESAEGRPGSEGGARAVAPAPAPRAPAYAALAPRTLPGDDPAAAAEAPYATLSRRRRNVSALSIGQSLSTTEGMAQAVVMAEVLQGRGGRGARAWKR